MVEYEVRVWVRHSLMKVYGWDELALSPPVRVWVRLSLMKVYGWDDLALLASHTVTRRDPPPRYLGPRRCPPSQLQPSLRGRPLKAATLPSRRGACSALWRSYVFSLGFLPSLPVSFGAFKV